MMTGAHRRRNVVHGLMLLCMALHPLMVKAGDGLDTLFTTPEERQRLDAIRKGGRPVPVLVPKPVVIRPQKSPTQVRLDGVVIRPDGVNTVWVGDNQPVASRKSISGLLVDPSRAKGAEVTVQAGGKDRVLKPGQAIDMRNNRISEAQNPQLPPTDVTGDCRRRRLPSGHLEIRC